MSCFLKQPKMIDLTLQKKLGEQIKFLREKQDMPQQVLAAKCNFEKGNLSRLEGGKVNPTLQTLSKIALALGVDIKELFNFPE